MRTQYSMARMLLIKNAKKKARHPLFHRRMPCRKASRVDQSPVLPMNRKMAAPMTEEDSPPLMLP